MLILWKLEAGLWASESGAWEENIQKEQVEEIQLASKKAEKGWVGAGSGFLFLEMAICHGADGPASVGKPT